MIDDYISFNLSERVNHDILTKERELELLEQYHSGDVRAMDTIINHNIRFILQQLRKLNFSHHMIQFGDDIFQQALIGYMTAIQRYDFGVSGRLNTYAGHWIRHEVTRYVYKGNCSSFINTPPHHALVINKILNCIRDYDAKTPQDVLDIVTMEIEEGLTTKYFPNRLPQYQASWDFHFIHQVISYDGIMVTSGDEVEEMNFLDVYQLPVDEPDEQFQDKELAHKLIKALRDERTADIIIRRFGINCEPETLDEIGKTYGISRERVRQLEAEGLRLMRTELSWLNLI